jgi:VIT1/CCC1 family predicted Fe2+/Mn2+ transporter
MKMGKYRYNIEKLVLVLFFTLFFLGIFIGSFNYRPGARFFPLVLSAPGFILIFLYLFRSLLPEAVNGIMEGESEFSVGARDAKEMRQKAEETQATSQEEDSDETTENSAIVKAYSVTIFTLLYILISYLIGFYISTIVALLVYFYISRRRTRKFILGNILLGILLIGIVYIFDIAFGHHFGLGVLTD